MATEWARCKGWINDAVAYCGGTHDIEDVWDEIQAGGAQFWPGKQSAVVTEIITFPKGTVLHFWLCGGDLDELVNGMRPAIEAWAKARGIERFSTAGRPGWQRVMKEHGYAPVWNVCMKGGQP